MVVQFEWLWNITNYWLCTLKGLILRYVNDILINLSFKKRKEKLLYDRMLPAAGPWVQGDIYNFQLRKLASTYSLQFFKSFYHSSKEWFSGWRVHAKHLGLWIAAVGGQVLCSAWTGGLQSCCEGWENGVTGYFSKREVTCPKSHS